LDIGSGAIILEGYLSDLLFKHFFNRSWPKTRVRNQNDTYRHYNTISTTIPYPFSEVHMGSIPSQRDSSRVYAPILPTGDTQLASQPAKRFLDVFILSVGE